MQLTVRHLSQEDAQFLKISIDNMILSGELCEISDEIENNIGQE